MLRFDYMPSDFHPIFLVLGEAEDLAELAKFLRSFVRADRRRSIVEAIPHARSRTDLVVVPAEDGFGLHDIGGSFEWRLNAWQADQIAERVEALAAADVPSGSDLIEVGSEGEIPVKVSRGEFTDDFLVTRR